MEHQVRRVPPNTRREEARHLDWRSECRSKRIGYSTLEDEPEIRGMYPDRTSWIRESTQPDRRRAQASSRCLATKESRSCGRLHVFRVPSGLSNKGDRMEVGHDDRIGEDSRQGHRMPNSSGMLRSKRSSPRYPRHQISLLVSLRRLQSKYLLCGCISRPFSLQANFTTTNFPPRCNRSPPTPPDSPGSSCPVSGAAQRVATCTPAIPPISVSFEYLPLHRSPSSSQQAA